MVPTLSPVLPIDNRPRGWKCLQPSQGRYGGSVGEQGGAVESPLKWEKGG